MTSDNDPDSLEEEQPKRDSLKDFQSLFNKDPAPQKSEKPKGEGLGDYRNLFEKDSVSQAGDKPKRESPRNYQRQAENDPFALRAEKPSPGNLSDFQSLFKTDYARTSPTYAPDKERGGCLTAYLVFLMIGAVVSGLRFLTLSSDETNNISSDFLIILIAVVLAHIACIVGLWNWKRWGYYGLLLSYGIGFVVGLLANELSSVVGGLVGGLILLTLMQDRMGYLD
jgi:hypothetical protein